MAVIAIGQDSWTVTVKISKASPANDTCQIRRREFNMAKMKASELFGVLIRFAGFLIFIYGLYEIWGGLENSVENLLPGNQGDNGEQVSVIAYFAFGIPSLLAGAVIFFGADLIAGLAYRNSKS